MRTDDAIRDDVIEELRWTPNVDEKDIAVKVNDGVVTLTGFVKSLAESDAAEKAAKRIDGVRALANDLVVSIPAMAAMPDPEIARNAITAIERDLPHSARLIQVVVHAGHVTLDGKVEWQYQKERAEDCVRRLVGVRSVTNSITLEGKPVSADIKERIAAALKRSAQLEAEGINVEVHGPEVTLTGRVRSWAEHEIAADTAWSAPGVLEVKNHICVGPCA